VKGRVPELELCGVTGLRLLQGRALEHKQHKVQLVELEGERLRVGSQAGALVVKGAGLVAIRAT